MRGSRQLQRNLDTLRAFFGDDLPAIVADNERRSESARRLTRQIYAPPGSDEAKERGRKAGLARRGKPRPPEQYRKMLATNRARGVLGQEGAFLRTHMRQLSRRALQSLLSYLHWHQAPSPPELRELAVKTAKRLELTPGAVWAIWRSKLQERGFEGRGGRRPLEYRHALIDELMSTWPRGPAGRVKDGFWEEAARRVTEAEGQALPSEGRKEWSYDQLQEWYRRHTREPGRCELQARSA